MNHPFILLGAGVDAVPIIQIIKAMGHRVLVVDADKQALGLTFADDHRVASCYDAKETLEALFGLRPIGVLCAGVDAPGVQQAVANTFRLIGPAGAAYACRNKVVMHNRLATAGIRVSPMTTDMNNAALVANRDGWVVVKPIDSRGARGVFRVQVRDAHDFWQAAAAFSASHIGVMAQQWVDGQQLSTESLVQGGKVLWTSIAERNYARLEEFAPHVIEDGSDIPWLPMFDSNGLWPEAQVDDTLQQCVDAIGLVNGTLKGDLVWSGVVHVIEVAPRLSGGGFCSVLTPAAWGVPFVELAAKIAMGEYVDVGIRQLKQHVCQRFTFPTRPTNHPTRGSWVAGYGINREAARSAATQALFWRDAYDRVR